MKNAVIIHGRPARWEYYLRKIIRRPNSKAHWLNWLRNQLIAHGYTVYAPEIPEAYNPQWNLWVAEVEKSKIGPETLLVGHSCGAGFWLRYLSEHPELKVGKVVLVAPWLDLQKKRTTDFFNFKIDKNLVVRTKGLTIFYSDNDMKSVKLSVQKIKAKLKDIKYKKFHGYAHFTYIDMKTSRFPELLEECLEW
jgi:predicted alpha/beta hydrolase family esterase